MQTMSDKHIRGIDVSHHQPDMPWEALKAEGIEFVYIKATEGVTYQDPKYKQHYEGARRAGLKIGFYHYARPYNDPRKEVENLLKATKDLPRDLPYALDIETDEDRFGASHITRFCKVWLETIEQRTGETPILYTYTHFAKSYLGKELARWPLWIAHYGVKTPGHNGIWDKWSIFQYTSDGGLKSYRGRLDLNVMEPDFLEQEKGIFPDVPANHWAASGIQFAKEKGLLVGDTKGNFNPNEPVTRAQLAVVLKRLLEGK